MFCQGFGAEAHSAILIPGNNLYPLKLISKLYSKALKDIEEGDDAGVALELWTHILVENVTESKSKSKGGNGKRWSIKTSRGSIDSFVSPAFLVVSPTNHSIPTGTLFYIRRMPTLLI